jgi:hypothetical protein
LARFARRISGDFGADTESGDAWRRFAGCEKLGTKATLSCGQRGDTAAACEAVSNVLEVPSLRVFFDY